MERGPITSDQLPSIIPLGALATPVQGEIVPALVGWRYIEFFTANIRNPHTRRAYGRACNRFFAWCEDRRLTLATIRPFNVAAWIEQLQTIHSPLGVKQQLAAVRMLFDWLVAGQIVPMNPAAAVQPERESVRRPARAPARA